MKCLRDWWRSRSDRHLSASWIRSIQQRSSRIQYDGPNWNWRALQEQAKQRDWLEVRVRAER